MSNYEDIDPVLAKWAISHSLVWLTDYQGSEVRTFFLRPDSKERVQVWVDPPKLSRTTVHVFQQKSGKRTRKIEEFSTNLLELPKFLDKALDTASKWLT